MKRKVGKKVKKRGRGGRKNERYKKMERKKKSELAEYIKKEDDKE